VEKHRDKKKEKRRERRQGARQEAVLHFVKNGADFFSQGLEHILGGKMVL